MVLHTIFEDGEKGTTLIASDITVRVKASARPSIRLSLCTLAMIEAADTMGYHKNLVHIEKQHMANGKAKDITLTNVKRGSLYLVNKTNVHTPYA